MNALTIHPKVAGSSLSGALTLIILYAVSTFLPSVKITPEVAAAITLILTFAGGWLAPAAAASKTPGT